MIALVEGRLLKSIYLSKRETKKKKKKIYQGRQNFMIFRLGCVSQLASVFIPSLNLTPHIRFCLSHQTVSTWLFSNRGSTAEFLTPRSTSLPTYPTCESTGLAKRPICFPCLPPMGFDGFSVLKAPGRL